MRSINLYLAALSMSVASLALGTGAKAQTPRIDPAVIEGCGQPNFDPDNLAKRYPCADGSYLQGKVTNGIYTVERRSDTAAAHPVQPSTRALVDIPRPPALPQSSPAHVVRPAPWRALASNEFMDCRLWQQDQQVCVIWRQVGDRTESTGEGRHYDLAGRATSEPVHHGPATANGQPSLDDLVRAQTALDNEKTRNAVKLINTERAWDMGELAVGAYTVYHSTKVEAKAYGNNNGCNPPGYTGPIRTCR